MNINDMLKFDPLAQAEKITGESYKDDAETMDLGVGMALIHNQVKAAALEHQGDTHYNMSFDYALAVFKDLGFDVVYTEEFGGSCDVNEIYLLLWHPDGILGVLESYSRHQVNTAKIYYNWVPDEDVNPWAYTSSGHMAKRTDVNIWVGDHDAREGLRHNLNALMENGTFISPWEQRPFLWLLHYGESKTDDYDYQAINAKKTSMLPSEVFDAITPQDES